MFIIQSGHLTATKTNSSAGNKKGSEQRKDSSVSSSKKGTVEPLRSKRSGGDASVSSSKKGTVEPMKSKGSGDASVSSAGSNDTNSNGTNVE